MIAICDTIIIEFSKLVSINAHMSRQINNYLQMQIEWKLTDISDV
jgi:hypothetical protein